MPSPEKHTINPRHSGVRSALRIFGPLILLIGLILTIIAVANIVGSAGNVGGPSHAWLAFIGMPLLFIGLAMTIFGFTGAVSRYYAQEVAPVGVDTVNYLAEGIQPGLKSAAGAIRAGLSGDNESELTCPKCEAENEPGSKFCDQCGESLPTPIICAACGSRNDAASRFCDQCGKPIGAPA